MASNAEKDIMPAAAELHTHSRLPPPLCRESEMATWLFTIPARSGGAVLVPQSTALAVA